MFENLRYWSWLHRGERAERDVKRPRAAAAPYGQLTREEKRKRAPYMLGWEEGYAAARRIWLRTGTIPKINTSEVEVRNGENAGL